MIDYSKSSGPHKSSGQVADGALFLTGVELISNSQNDAALALFDGTDENGKLVYECYVGLKDNFFSRVWAYPIRLETGLYAQLDGKGARFVCEYIDNTILLRV